MRKILLLLILFVFTMNAFAFESLSYSGRLVNSDGSPLTGTANLKFDLIYSNSPSIIRCSEELNNVDLSNGVFHVKLEFPNCNLKDILTNTPEGYTANIRVVDRTGIIEKKYSYQAIYSVPFSFLSQMSKELAPMSATHGQVLSWDDSAKKWLPKSPESSSGGTVESITASDGLSGGVITATGIIGIADDGVSSLKILDGTITDADIASTAGISQTKILNLTTDLGNKENFISPATTSDYLAGDKNWQDFNQSVRSTFLLGYADVPTFTGLDATDTVLTAFGKLQSQITANDTAFDGTGKWDKDGALIFYNGGNVGVGTSTPSEAVDVVGNIAISGSLKLKSNTINNVEIKAPINLLSNLLLELPGDSGTAGDSLVTDGNGKLSWNSLAVDGSDITNGSITDAHVATGAAIDQSKINGLTTALAAKQDAISVSAPLNYNSGTKVISLNTVSTSLGGTGLTAPGAAGNLLRSDGTNWISWIPNFLTTESDPSVNALGTATLSCANGEIPKFNGTIWICAVDAGITSESDTLQDVTGRGATTTALVSFSGGAHFTGGSVGIGTNTPVSVLDIRSTTSGLLIPRMTTAERNLIASPAGMQIYNTTTNELNFHNGTTWNAIGVAGGVNSITAGTGLVSTTITDTGTINVDVGTTAGKIPQLNASGKLVSSVETDPSVEAFAKTVLPTCGVGQVLKSNGTAFSCVADAFLSTDGTTLSTSGSIISVKAEGILDTHLSGLSSSCGLGQILVTNGLGSFSCANKQWGEGAGVLYHPGTVAIGGSTPASSSVLDLQSTSKGFLPPRMTAAQRDAISSPAPGLLIYNTTSNSIQYYNNTEWVELNGGKVVLDTGTISGAVSLAKTLTVTQNAVVIFNSHMFGSNYPMVSLRVNGVACAHDRSFASTGNQYSSASCVKELAPGTHTIDSLYTETSGNSNMGTHSMSWVLISKSSGNSGTASSEWDLNGTDLSYSVGKVGIGTSSPQAALDVNGGIKVGTQATCNASVEGTQRYNSTLKVMEFCNGTNWNTIGATVGTPIGSIQTMMTTSCPINHLTANGAAVSRTTYAALFSAIGTMYGAGDGSTTFNLPDLRGYFLRGVSAGSGSDPDAASRTNRGDGTGGDNVGSKQVDAIQQHNHFMASEAPGTNNVVAFSDTNTDSTYASGGNVGSRGDVYIYVGDIRNGRAATETRPKNINVLYCIRY